MKLLKDMNEKERKARVDKLWSNVGTRSAIDDKYLSKSQLALRNKVKSQKKLSPERVTKLRSNPNTRASLPDRYLTTAQRQVRQQIKDDKTPIVAGSQITGKDLRRSRHAAEILQFGPGALKKAQQAEKDTDSYYQQYLADLDRIRQQQAETSAQANTAAANLQAGIQAGTSNFAENQSAADAAAAVRKAIAGSYGQETATAGALRTNYISDLRGIAGLSRQQAQQRAKQSTADLRDKIGAWRTQFNKDTKDTEFNRIVAQQQLANATKTTDANIAIDQQNAKTKQQQADQDAASDAQKAEDKKLADRQKLARSKNQYGVSRGAWADWGKSEAGRKKQEEARQAFRDKQTGKGKSKGKGPGLASTSAHSSLREQISKGVKIYNDYLADKVTAPVGSRAWRNAVGNALEIELNGKGSAITDPLARSIVADLKATGYISQGTIDRLHDARYSVKQLNLKTQRSK